MKHIVNQNHSKITGYKNTFHQRNIRHLLENSKEPVTAGQVFFRLNRKGRQISLSTVYRILGSLEKNGFVHKIHFSKDESSRYALINNHHLHHFYCLGCHKMIELVDCPLGEYERSLHLRNGLVVTGHQLELFGYCHDCRK